MKLSIFKSAALAAMMATTLAACTNEAPNTPGTGGSLAFGPGEDIIRISLSNSTGTRAARPIGSSEAANNVNRIAFMFLTSATAQTAVEGITLEGVINETNGESEDGYVADGNVLKLPENYDGSEICVKFSGLQEGSYKILAYGYNYAEGTDAADTFPYELKLKGENYLLQCEQVTDVQEIFAGHNQGQELVAVNQHGKFGTVPEIELERQVAGLMAYFANAPVFVDNKKVAKITVSSKTDVTGFYFPASLIPNDSEYNGMKTESWNENGWIDYLTFDMTQASNYASASLDSGDHYTFDNQEKGFLLANETAPINALTCNEDTLFGSCFLLAYPGIYDCSVNEPKCATLNICYWAEDGSLILCVPLRNGGNANDKLGASSYQYHILCNNFYAIGTKNALDGEPGNNQPLDIDEPTGYDYAQVSINNDWTQTHDLIN